MLDRDMQRIIEYRYSPEALVQINGDLDRRIACDDRIYAVIDDDPTGGQTVHDVEVLTSWDEKHILDSVKSVGRMFFIMTNSRSMTTQETGRIHREIMQNLAEASAKTGRAYEVISRSDSTLRGHYPLEADLIAQAFGNAKHILIPFFPEGGRYTIGDIHYLMQESCLIPVGISEFSRDKTFGYRASDLKQWIEEKTKGRILSEQVGSVTLEMLRAMDYQAISRVLRGKETHIVVNATCYDDLRVFAIAYLDAIAAGEHFVMRTAAAWPKVIGGISDSKLLDCKDMCSLSSQQGGLIVVGSHVQKTTAQFEELRQALPRIAYIEFNQHLALNAHDLWEETRRVCREASEQIRRGRTCAVYTRRERIDWNMGSGEDELIITRRISKAVTDIVRELEVVPRFILAKGGITSSDIAVHALKTERAMILGQIAPGVPVWKLGEESKYPGMPYIIFPGNVGDTYTLRDIVIQLERKE